MNPTAETYEEVAKQIDVTCWRFIRKFNVHEGFDEVRSQANLYFMIAYHSHDPEKPFETWVRHIVFIQLLDKSRREWRRSQRHPRVPLDPQTPAATPEEGFDIPELLGSLSGDDLVALETALGTLDEVRPGWDSGRIRRNAKKKLQQKGWSRRRIEAAFDRVGKVLFQE
jgi:DNA-directed RNA polymerase specialized sigma24 family protein